MRKYTVTNLHSATKLPKADGTIGPFGGESEVDGQAQGGRRRQSQISQALPTLSGLSKPAGQLLRGATDDKGDQKAAALLVGIKLDLEAEVHLTARVKGDICVGLY
ncbi:hypothetical protein MAC_05718 [Metarhizium acridum CQMa 102]|uniref:Uncharacterized protein n=1 Tax=Metarhizium acridum (strain CQMa 102) TaxID=655827 RepID=E9E770_METAQ|nr:uncharacterized protein MAC_05718 [Metarhizium acridum CQMa 102]EFY88245.1 hypothetical protein MAC_05718 [Metarhizium acridum CQMa 102]